MPIGYLFSAEGEITKVKLSQTTVDDLPASIIGYEDQPSMYCESFPENFFLMMHEDNDFPKNYKKSKLPINKALRLYFPNSPYKGNALLIKLTDDDAIAKGNWSYSRLKQFRMGYSKTWKDDVNRPTVVIAKDVSSLSEYPMIGETTEKGGNELKKCEKCGLVETYLHYDECRIQQTKIIVKKIDKIRKTHPAIDKILEKEYEQKLEKTSLTWKYMTSFSQLQKKGLNQTGITWVNLYLETFAQFEEKKATDKDKEIILHGLILFLCCYDINSGFSIVEECQYCKDSDEKCLQIRVQQFEDLTQVLIDMEYSHADRFKNMKVVFPHLTINIFGQLLTLYNKEKVHDLPPETKSLPIFMIDNWATLLINEYEFHSLMAEVDNEIFN
jgi:hypothetical protein